MMKITNDIGILVLRLSIGILMLLHGLAKIGSDLGFIKGMLGEMGMPAFFSYGVLIGEIIAPLALIIGYRTRIAALVYAFNCLVAILMVHTNDIFKLGDHGGWAIELLGLYLFGAIALVFTGAGNIAISKSNTWD